MSEETPRGAPPMTEIHYIQQGAFSYPCGQRRGDATSSKRGVTCPKCRSALKLSPMTKARQRRVLVAWNREGA